MRYYANDLIHTIYLGTWARQLVGDALQAGPRLLISFWPRFTYLSARMDYRTRSDAENRTDLQILRTTVLFCLTGL